MCDMKSKIIIAFATLFSIILLQAFIGFSPIVIIIMIAILLTILFTSKVYATKKIRVMHDRVYIPELNNEVSYFDVYKTTLCLIKEGKKRGYELIIELNNGEIIALNSINVTHYWELIDLARNTNDAVIIENVPESEEKLLQLLDDWIEHCKGTYV